MTHHSSPETDTALLPCPFCGEPPVYPNYDAGDDDFVVMCKSCGSSSRYSDVQADVISAWNTRAAPAQCAPGLDGVSMAIEACARLVETTDLRNHDNIARDIRALAVTSTEREPGLGWTLSEEAKQQLADIDNNIRQAPQNIANALTRPVGNAAGNTEDGAS